VPHHDPPVEGGGAGAGALPDELDELLTDGAWT